MRKRIENPMKGLYQQKGKLGWWFRLWHDGKQIYFNCKTRDVSVALEEKKKILNKIARKVDWEEEEITADAKTWDKHVSDYLSDKRAKGEMRPGTEVRVKSVLRKFQKSAKVTSPEKVTLKMLGEFFKEYRKSSNSTAKTYLATVQAFLNDLGMLRERYKLPKTIRVSAREEFEDMDVINKWIADCPELDLKYVLYCMGSLGMRAGEVKFSHVSWFDAEFCNIPARMTYTLKNGKKMVWQPKDSEARSIPLTPEMKGFLSSFLNGKKGFVIKSEKSKDGTWDFRKPFTAYMKHVGREDFYPHAFRHSWITYLMNNGYSIQDVAMWSGDTLETLEKHYWKKKKKAGALDVSGKPKETETEKQLKLMTGQMDEMKKIVGTMLTVVQKTKKKKITKSQALKELKNNPTFAPVVEDFSTRAMLDKMSDEQREKFLNSLPV